MDDVLRLFIGTVVLRPYVFAFLAVYLVASGVHLGWRRTFLFIPLGYATAWISEFASIHWGFPYGDYFYIPTTSNRELWIFGVPFMDSLSYVFLAYCSYSTAICILSPMDRSNGMVRILETLRLRRSWQTLSFGAFLFVLLDIIIDPVALQGGRWFLGQIYGYRTPGLYFGIPMSNFGGWLLMGFAMIGVLQLLDRMSPTDSSGLSTYHRLALFRFLGPVLYVSVLIFNLSITFWIGETFLGMVGCLVIFFPALFTFFFTVHKLENVPGGAMELHLADFPVAPSRAPHPLPHVASNPAPHGHLLQEGQGEIQKSP
jgi:putative membrane protein